jgi:hypothetical protein
MGADGSIAAAWIAHDRDADTLHLYDSAMFKREVLAVIAEGITARGRWIPMAWHKDMKDAAAKLVDRGCNMEPSHALGSDSSEEVTARDMWERMRTGRFKVDRRNAEWRDELKGFNRRDAKIPLESHPLMAATLCAVSMLEYARAPASRVGSGKSFPKVAMI